MLWKRCWWNRKTRLNQFFGRKHALQYWRMPVKLVFHPFSPVRSYGVLGKTKWESSLKVGLGPLLAGRFIRLQERPHWPSTLIKDEGFWGLGCVSQQHIQDQRSLCINQIMLSIWSDYGLYSFQLIASYSSDGICYISFPFCCHFASINPRCLISCMMKSRWSLPRVWTHGRSEGLDCHRGTTGQCPSQWGNVNDGSRVNGSMWSCDHEDGN